VKTKYYARLPTTAIQGFTSSILHFSITWMDALAINSPHIHCILLNHVNNIA